MALTPPTLTLSNGVTPVTPTLPRNNPIGDPNSLDPAQRARFTQTLVNEIRAGGELGMSPFEPSIAGYLKDGVKAGHITAGQLDDLRGTYVRNNIQRVLADMRDGMTSLRDAHTQQVLRYALERGMLTRADFDAAVEGNKASQKRSMDEIRRILRNP